MDAPLGAVQSLYKDVAGTLYFEIPEGRVTAALLTITKADGTALTTPVSAVDIKSNFAAPAVDTTLNGAVLKDATVLTVVSVTGITPEYSFLLDAGLAVQEWAKVKAVNGTAKTVTLCRPLERGHDNGTKLQSTALYYDVVAGNNDSVMQLNKASLLYTVSSQVYRRNYLYDVKLNQWLPTLTEVRLFDAYPRARQWGYSEQKGFDAQIREAARRVRSQMFLLGKDIDDLVDGRSAEDAHLAATIWVIVDNWAQKDGDMADYAALKKKEFLGACADLKALGRWWETSPQDGQKGDSETQYAKKAVLA